MENRRIIKTAAILGGALISALLITSNSVFAYNQDKTHPALTDEIVDFYNLNFPANKLTEQEKLWLVQGSVEEDIGERPIFHFYDPVNNRGIAHFSSKEWALKSSVQANYYNSQLTGFAAISGGDSVNDFSYGRALDDYAKGDRQRAFVAFGHTLHLFEDAGVPDHTRGDPHPPVLDWGSPYEHEMAKWNPDNFQIARKLFLTREKPVASGNMVDYFDKIANYSNNNFFSKDTINNNTYSQPSIKITKKIKVNGAERLFIIKNDLPLAFVAVDSITGSVIDIKLIKPEIGSYILDGYWDRLSREIVLNGAGALNLFLTEAEKAKAEYANRPPEKPNWFARLFGLIGFGNKETGLTTLDVVNPQGVDNLNDGDSEVTPTSEVTNSEVSPTSLVTKTPVTNVTIVSPSVSPSKTPTPTPKLSATPTLSPTPKLSTAKKSGSVVINEIAWAGTLASATDEWIELYNTENVPIDISSWQLVSNDDSPDIIFQEGTIIQANSYFLIERTDDNTVSDITADLAVGFGQGGLNNAGEMMRLFDSAGIVVDVVGSTGEAWYHGGSTSGDSSSKNSMERIDSIKAGNNASNWKSFSGTPINKDATGGLINGTPKAKNSLAVQVVVSTGGGGSGGGGGGGGSSSSPTPTPSPTPSVSPSPTPTPTLSPTPTPSPGPEGDTANPGDVLINEIAWMGTASSANDEWMEIRNTTNQTINLTGWILSAQDGTPNITLSGSISPLGFYLLERTDETTLPDITADQIYTGALGNTGENLVLKNVSGTIIDQIDGSNEWKINGASEIIGNNNTKETAQKMGSGWITALATPRAQNSVNATVQAPSAITNLLATINSPLTVSWSAPNPGGYSPASLSYDLRYSTANFPASNSWDWALKIASSSLPSIGTKGAHQSASFDIAHEYGQTLYFAIKTKVINITTPGVVSPQSNVATVSFPSAIDANAWAMLGKDQYHTSFAANITGPDPMATIIWGFEVGSVASPLANVFRSDSLSASCLNGGDNIRLYDHNHNSLGAWPCSGQYFNTWGSNFNSSFNDTIFTEFEQVGTLPCGTYENCENAETTLAIRRVVLRADGWTPTQTWSVGQPVVSANGDVFFGASNGITSGLYGLDKNGIAKLPYPYTTNTKPGIAVVLSDGSVYFGKDGVIIALNSNGSLKWTYDSAGTGIGPLTLAKDGSVYFASWGNNKLNALKSDGSLKWQIGNPIGNFGTFSPIILENGNIVIPARVSGHSYFYAYDSASGSQLWEATFPEGYGYLPSHPSFYSDTGTGKINSAVGPYLVQISETGELTKTFIDFNGISTTMVSISPSSLMVGFDFTNYNPASGSQVIALDKSTKGVKWRFKVDSRINNQIAIDKDENVYFSTQNGKLYGLNSNGELIWVIDVSTPSDISPILTGQGVVWGYGSRLTGIGVK